MSVRIMAGMGTRNPNVPVPRWFREVHNGPRQHCTDHLSSRAMSAPASSPLLVKSLRKRYADVTAVDGLDLEIAPGECFGLLGPNGAGKTTTIEICEGL